ncbi:MAG TPA: hypothetical protein VM686_40780, partial [Polyangiaceae bacterium]|nr:hypothetical protein [Polyangiaceae bacterium]
MLARSALVGASLGLLAGALGSGLLWWQRQGSLRPWAPAALGLLGALIGIVVARRRRLRDSEVALFLDARFGSNESVTTALELRGNGDLTPAAIEVVEAAALRTLEESDPKRARPRLHHRLNWLAPIGVAAAAAISLAPLPPPPPAPPPAPGSELVKLQKLAGLERIEALEQLNASTPE